MKTRYNLFIFSLFLVVSLASCSQDAVLDEIGGDTKAVSFANDVYELVLDENTLLNPGISPNDAISTRAGSYWDQTYVDGSNIRSRIFTFAHTAADYGEYGRYWDGMTVSSVNDTTNYAFNGPNGSNIWISHQWGSMAGNNSSEALEPFIITYWSGYANGDEEFPAEGKFSENTYSAWVKLGQTGELYAANSIQISMHPWAYWGCVTGDGFARPLTQKDDYFTLFIYGVDASGNIKEDVVEHEFVNVNDGVFPAKGWTTVNISALGNVNYLIFQMKSSDSSEYGGVTYNNTATYFCMKKLTVSGPVN